MILIQYKVCVCVCVYEYFKKMFVVSDANRNKKTIKNGYKKRTEYLIGNIRNKIIIINILYV